METCRQVTTVPQRDTLDNKDTEGCEVMTGDMVKMKRFRECGVEWSPGHHGYKRQFGQLRDRSETNRLATW